MISIEWSYLPADCFEEPAAFQFGELSLALDSGRATALTPRDDREIHDIIDAARGHPRNVLRGPQLVSHKAFEISAENIVEIRPDGTRNLILTPVTGRLSVVGGMVDIRIEGNGGVLVDTRQERIDRKRWLADAFARHQPVDRTLQRMVRSYDAAARDPGDELIHLYELVDAIKARAGHSDLKASVGLGGSRMESFKRLCNDAPVLQGRHRGKKVEVDLRDASPEELREARSFAAHVIETYVRWLDGQRS